MILLLFFSCLPKRKTIPQDYVKVTFYSFTASSSQGSADGFIMASKKWVRVDILGPFGRRVAVYIEGPGSSLLLIPPQKEAFLGEPLGLLEKLKSCKRAFTVKVGDLTFRGRINEKRVKRVPKSTFNLKVPQGYRIFWMAKGAVEFRFE